MSLRHSALVTGIAGQDGSYLAEFLLARGYTVVGVGHRADEVAKRDGLMLASCDTSDSEMLRALLSDHRPTEVYNLAALSSGAGMFDDAVRIGDVNGLAVTRLLETIRQTDLRIRFCQASSSEMFGNATESPQSERTELRPRSPYGAAKTYAHDMLRIYRERYGLFACSAILFNHESPRRGPAFVTRKVARAAAAIKLGRASSLALGNLEARRDWGFAGDYVEAMWLMLCQERPGDYVVATGQTHSVRELCEVAFGHVGLDYRNYVHAATELTRDAERMQLVGDASKARAMLNWMPRVSFEEMVAAMVDAELEALRVHSRETAGYE